MDSQRLLVAYVDSINGLTLDHSMPCVAVEEIAYFIKQNDMGEITQENFFDCVQYGTVTAGSIQVQLSKHFRRV